MMAWKKKARSYGPTNVVALMQHLTTSTFNVNLVRVGDSVELVVYARQLNVAGLATGGTVLVLPTGFRPAVPYRVYTTAPSTAQLDVAASGAVTVVTGSLAQGTYLTLRLAHLTTEAVPTSIPGVND